MGLLEQLNSRLAQTNQYLATICNELKEAREEFSEFLDKWEQQNKE
jgi:hypothetical protein